MSAQREDLVKPNDIEELMSTTYDAVEIALQQPNVAEVCPSLSSWEWTLPTSPSLIEYDLIEQAASIALGAVNSARAAVTATCSSYDSTVKTTHKSVNNSGKNGTVKSSRTTGYNNSVKNGTVYGPFCNPDT